jgi:colicin import membrane protein
VKFSRSEPGFALSAAIHFGLLAAMLVAFSQDRKFDDAQEAVPVETITDSQFSQIMKGEKTAKAATGKPRADRVAEVSEPKPTPPTPEAKRDIPMPPPPLKRQPDPGEAEEKPLPPTPTAPPPPTPKPPTPPAPPTPPQRPAPPKPAPKAPPQEDKEEPEKDDAEPIKPPVKPKPPEKAEAKPTPPTPPTPPKPEPKPTPKPEPKAEPKTPKLDEVAKLLAQSKDKGPAAPNSRPKSGEESNERQPSPNLAEISRMLSREAPSALGSTGRELNKTASLGAPNASAAKMSPSLSDALNGLLMEQYKSCWSYLPLSNGPKYVPWIRVAYRPDGSLAGEPVLTNPPSDPVSRALAESAMRAVRRCNPLKIPARFQPFYDQWKDWKVGFDPVILN